MDFHLIPRSHDRNYTGFLTKTIVYSGTLVLFLGCATPSPSFSLLYTNAMTEAFGLTLSSIVIPNWVNYHSNEVRSFIFSPIST